VLAAGLDLWPVTHRFNIVTIRTNDKGAVVVRVVMGPQTRRPVVLATGGDGAAKEVVDLTPSLCGKGKVQWSTFHRARAEPERRFVVSSQPYGVRNLHYNSDAERGKRLDEECLARFEITGADSYVIEHGFLLYSDA
jgi:hypothetical protein